ncbi:hypothetical protein [Streptomyces cucumeris]|uniref:hypothetical protein n=1 Tax=Streptomyces cucumeris TaxID=2962890 RepID=UPI0020C8B3D4|nr:hypothetical protein [Streptomyces sp. NEAU-Y11]MCP9207115.1 hypothetical protein [Streptomyces sp. NEAU-Y11]
MNPSFTTAASACALCARPGDFGRLDPSDPHAGLCPDCIAAGQPTRDALERSVAIVAKQHLAAAEALVLTVATPEEMTYHLGTLRVSLRGVLQLIAREDCRGEGRDD